MNDLGKNITINTQWKLNGNNYLIITGKINNRIDQFLNTFWRGDITNDMDILSQMTYRFFMKMQDDAQTN